jgi:hypothetical protein
MTHEYKRQGTTTLFAALNMAEGSLLSTYLPRHRPQEWLRFLRLIDRQVPQGTALHLIADNYAMHQHPTVQRGGRATRASRCTSRRPGVPGSIWSNASLATLTAKQLRRDVFRSVPELTRIPPSAMLNPHPWCGPSRHGKFWQK